MATSSDFTSGDAPVIRQRKGSPIKFLVPLIYAPALPLIRIVLRHKPVARDRLFFGVLAGAFAHGAYLVYGLNYSLLVFAYPDAGSPLYVQTYNTRPLCI